VSGATVDIETGEGAGLRTSTTSSGQYALYGVAGPVEVRVSGEGFDSKTTDVVVSDDKAVANFITSYYPPGDASGRWTLTLSPSESCRDRIPQSLWSRTYPASISQDGSSLVMTFTSASFDHNPQQATGTIHGQIANIIVAGDTDEGSYSYPNFFDQISPTEWYNFEGLIRLTLSAGTLQGTMNGDIEYWKSAKDLPAGVCRAVDHPVLLSAAQ
jgi:hypothetical protein